MQKRGRILDNKMKRMQISRRGRPDTKDSLSLPLAYTRLTFLWFAIVAMDAITGFRVELLWPCWLMLRAGYDAFYKNQQNVSALTSPNPTKFSVLFVCITATSDLICYLFIPVRMLIFIATTYVWIDLIWHTHGGFIRTANTMFNGNLSQTWLILVLSGIAIIFEIGMRLRFSLDFLVYSNRDQSFANFGISPMLPRSMNAFFSAHCIGYPIVLFTFSMHYYLSEWKLRRRQGGVAAKNEHLFKILTESLPADYESSKDYLSSTCLDDDLSFMLEPAISSQFAITGSYGNINNNPSSTKKNGYHKTTKRGKKNGGLNSTPPVEKKKKEKIRREEFDDIDDSDVDDYNTHWDEPIEDRRRSGLSIIRLLWDLLSWSVRVVKTVLGCRKCIKEEVVEKRLEKFDELEEEDEGDEEMDLVEKKLQIMNGRPISDSLSSNATGAKSRSNTGQSSRQNQSNKRLNGTVKSNNRGFRDEKTHGHARIEGGSGNGSIGCGGSSSIRDSSHDTNTSNNNEAEMRSMQREIDSLRAELNSKRSNEEDMKLQMKMLESNETSLSQTITHMRLRIDQMENKCNTLEKHRESDRMNAELSEQRYTALMARKSELEQALFMERKARNEDTGKKMDLAEHQREKERQLEKEVDRLRAELKGKQETFDLIEGEVSRVRMYKEENETLRMELRLQRENVAHMECAMVSENKLKQELFRALGLSQNKLHVSMTRSEALLAQIENRDPIPIDFSACDVLSSAHSSPRQQSTVGSPVPSAKAAAAAALSINCPNRSSPLIDKLSPIDAQTLTSPSVIPPPDYNMAVTHPKLDGGHINGNAPYQYIDRLKKIKLDFQPNSTTGEHLLFDAPPPPQSLTNNPPSTTCGASTNHDLLVSRHMGKFGAPSNPARSN